jgi:hypothetical protein
MLTKPGLSDLDLAPALELALVTINVTPGSTNRTCGSTEGAGRSLEHGHGVSRAFPPHTRVL